MIARRAGTVVSLGMLIGVVAGCGSQLDPRLQPNDSLRESCSLNEKSYTDEQIRGILGEIEQRRLNGTRQVDAYAVFDQGCNLQYDKYQDQFLCRICYQDCIDQVYNFNPLPGP